MKTKILTLLLILYSSFCFSQDVVKFNYGHGNCELKLETLTEKLIEDTLIIASNYSPLEFYEIEYKLASLPQAIENTNKNLRIFAGLQLGGVVLSTVGGIILAEGDKEFKSLGYINLAVGLVSFITSYIPLFANNRHFYVTKNGIGIQLSVKEINKIKIK